MATTSKTKVTRILSLAAATAFAGSRTRAQVAPGAIELDVNPTTGDIQLNGNNATNVGGFEITSLAGGLNSDADFTPAFTHVFPNYLADTNSDLFPTKIQGTTVNGALDMGDFYNAVQNSSDLFFDVVFKSGAIVRGNVNYLGIGIEGVNGMWNGGSGNWSNPAMWDTGVVPNSSTAAVQVNPLFTTSSVLKVDENVAVGLISLPSKGTLAVNPGQTFTLTSTSTSTVGTLRNAGTVIVENGELIVQGGSSTAFVVDPGATLNLAGALTLATSQDWGGGTILEPGLLAVNGSESIGSTSGGSITQSGQYHTVTASLNIAPQAGETATYTLSGPYAGMNILGTVNVGGATAGTGGAGVFNIQGGTATLNTLKIWDTPGTAFNLSGGTLSYQTLDTSGNLSRFNWTGGTIQFTATGSIPLSTIPSAGALLLSPGSASVQVTGPAGGVVNNGTLILDKGSFSAQFTGNVTNNGTISYLGGTRTIAGNVVNNGTIAAGDAQSTLAVNALTLNPQSTVSFNLGAPGTNSSIDVLTSGALNVAGTTALILTNAGGMTYGTYPLLDYSGSFAGSLSNLVIANAPSGYFYTISNDSVHDVIDLTVGTSGVSGTGNAQLWLGGTGNYSDATKWAGGVVPGGLAENLFIDGGNATASVLTVDQNVTVGTVTLDADDAIVINRGNTLTLGVAATSTFNGPVTNGGTIALPIGMSTFSKGISGNGVILIGGGSTSVTANVNALTQGSVTVGANAVLNVGAPTVYGSGSVVASGGLTTPILISGALTITNGGVVHLNATTAGNGQTHSIGSLAIGTNSVLDTGNHTVVVQNVPDEKVIQQEVFEGDLHGISDVSGVIVSSTVKNDSTGSLAIGYGNAADFTGTPSPYAPGAGSSPLSGNQEVIKPTLAGDLFLQGKVGFADLSVTLTNYDPLNNPGPKYNEWVDGNIDDQTDGTVDTRSVQLVQQNYGKSLGGASTLVATPTLTGVRRAVFSPAPAAANDGIDLIVNPQTGDVQLSGNNAQAVMAVDLVSSTGNLVINNPFASAAGALMPNSAASNTGELAMFDMSTNGVSINGLVDMGNIYNTLGDTSDLSFQYSERGVNNGLPLGGSIYAVTPEPAALSLIGLAAGGLLSRRKRRIS